MLVYEGEIPTLITINIAGDFWTNVTTNGSSGHPADNSPQFGMLLTSIKKMLEPFRSHTQQTPFVPEVSVVTTLVESTQVPGRLFISREPRRFTDVFVNNLDLPPEIVTPPIEATLYPSWLQWRNTWRRRAIDIGQNPGQAPPTTDTALVESTLIPGWKFHSRQPRRAIEGFNPFLPPLLRTCEIITLFTTNYRKANPNPMMPVARITRIYRVKGLVHC